MRIAITVSMVLLATIVHAAPSGEVPIPKFSSVEIGSTLPEGWEKVELPYGKKSELHIVPEGKLHVLQVHADGSFGSIAYRTSVQASEFPILRWRWKVDHVVDKAQMDTKEGEDFAARMYVSFDFPPEELSRGERVKLGIASAAMGFVPAAAICYVWDNQHPVGTSRWSPHFGHVRVIVLESGNERAGQWAEEKRDIEADFVEAFGEKWKGRVPKITGVVAGSDTDQTGESVTTWFGNIHLEPRL